MKNGRPTKYRKEYDEQAYKQCLVYNATHKTLAEFFEVSIDTITEWKSVHPSFSASLDKGKFESDYDVVQSLYKSATGFDSLEVKTEGIADPDNPTKIIGTKVTKTKRQVAPNIGAIKTWLANRQPEHWRNNDKSKDNDDGVKSDYLDAVQSEIENKD